MECPSCGFNNIPGTTRCARCKAQLATADAGAPEELAPPRAGRLRALRPLWYGINRLVDRLPRRVPQRLARLFVGSALPGDAVGAMVLSALPGLGHLVSGRRRTAMGAFAVWAVLAFVTAAVYGGTMGYVCLGLTLVWHSAVMFDAGEVQRHATAARARVTTMLLLVSVTATGYFLLHLGARTQFDFVPSGIAVPELDLQVGDVVLARRGRFEPGDLARGELVSYMRETSEMIRIGAMHYLDLRTRGPTVGRILAIEGDEVEVSRAGLTVNRQRLRPEHLSLDRLPLPDETLAFRVRDGRVLVTIPISGRVGHLPAIRQVWSSAFLLRVSQVRGRAWGVYLPLLRRHFFRSTALGGDGEP